MDNISNQNDIIKGEDELYNQTFMENEFKRKSSIKKNISEKIYIDRNYTTSEKSHETGILKIK